MSEKLPEVAVAERLAKQTLALTVDAIPAEVLARAEGDRRLVRPIHIEIQRVAFDPNARGAKQTDGALPLVEARLEFDAVFGAAITAAVEEQP